MPIPDTAVQEQRAKLGHVSRLEFQLSRRIDHFGIDMLSLVVRDPEWSEQVLSGELVKPLARCFLEQGPKQIDVVAPVVSLGTGYVSEVVVEDVCYGSETMKS